MVSLQTAYAVTLVSCLLLVVLVHAQGVLAGRASVAQEAVEAVKAARRRDKAAMGAATT